MFYSVTGNIIKTFASATAVECSGVAFKINTSLNTLKKIGSEGNKVTLYTYLSVREDALDLFGFYDEDELECFKLLISVSGVGPKAAISILSLMSPEKFASAVIAGDQKAISKAPGIGTKTAARLVLELKEKLSKLYSAERASDSSDAPTADIPASDRGDAVAALSVLGYSNQEIDWALARVGDAVGTENIIKAALANLMKQ